jgi:acetyl-CoA carboxylase biotin carboxylase subunit
MNTRLQVEHPVTEMITGLDLVKEQIMIAAGEPLRFEQEDVEFRGSAIECRIYAEDPERNFAPSLGTISSLRLPEGPGVRNDFAIYEGYTIPIYYDPLIGKLIVWGKDRHEAIRRTHAALSEFVLEGVRTTVGFHRWVMENEHFISGNYDTHFIKKHFQGIERADGSEFGLAIALAAAMKFEEDMKPRVAPGTGPPSSRWKTLARRSMLRGGP